jgi:U4/U6.U5 tri-snRNP-associated protein 1
MVFHHTNLPLQTKAKRSSRRAQPKADPDDDVGDTAMVTDDKPIAPRARDLNTNFVDDDELQAALARSRRAKIMKTKKLSPQEIAAKLAAERVGGEPDPADEITGGLTFDDTSEFVRAVQYNPVAVDPEHVETPVKHQPRDISIGPADEPMEEIEAGQITATVKEEEEDEGVVVKTEETEHGDSQDLGTSSQQNYSCMASTLNILRQQGILNTPTADQVDRERTQVQRDLWLAEQRLRLSQREMEKLQGRGQNKDNATREYDNRMREQQEARDSSEAFKNYKPAIDLTEYDEFGRAMTRMEAWKALSHKFHGKGSGKMKLEKRLKKIAEEKKREAMVSGDTPLGMNKAFQQLQEKSGQAHFVLSVGNRG